MDVRIAATIFAVCMPLCAPAQQDELSQERERQTVPEEVLTTGDRSIPQLRMQMMEAERAAYDTFNRFNDEKRFNIRCSMHQPTGSRIQRQVCQPGFVIDAATEHGREYWESLRIFADPETPSTGHSNTYQPAAAVIASQQPEYQRKMRQVAEEHPEFLEALIQYSTIREQYEAMTRSAGE